KNEERGWILHKHGSCVFDVGPHPFRSLPWQRNDSRLSSLPCYAQGFLFQIDAFHRQCQRLTYSQASAVDKLEQGSISKPLGCLGIGTVKQRNDLLKTQRLWQRLRLTKAACARQLAIRTSSLLLQELQEGTQGAEPSLRSGSC